MIRVRKKASLGANMEARSLRYTGENPPVEVLAKYPNWVNAYDEEDVEGQDETTLKPEDVQAHVTDETTFTAGDIVFADGTTLPVLISLLSGEVTGFCVYRVPEWPYLSHDAEWNLWSVLPDYGSQDRDRSEQWWKTQRFPAQLASRLPFLSTGTRWELAIDEHGMVAE
jgi:hypothetical protein